MLSNVRELNDLCVVCADNQYAIDKSNTNLATYEKPINGTLLLIAIETHLYDSIDT